MVWTFSTIWTPRYRRLRSYDRSSTLDGHDKGLTWSVEASEESRSFRSWKTTLVVCLNIALFVWSLLLLISQLHHEAHDRRTVSPFTVTSPLLRDIDVPIVEKRMNGTLLIDEADEMGKLLRGQPSPEVDHAWALLSDTRPFSITEEDVMAMGKDPARSVQYNSSFGLGSGAYAGRLDVLHQIHCLDAIRREAYWEHYYTEMYPGGPSSTPDMHKLHLSHCIYYLLQNIMCTANLDVYTHIWTDTFSHPWPDFGITRQCRSFDTILDWQRKHAVDQHAFADMQHPPDFDQVANMTRKFKEVNHYYDTHVDDGSPGEVIG